MNVFLIFSRLFKYAVNETDVHVHGFSQKILDISKIYFFQLKWK